MARDGHSIRVIGVSSSSKEDYQVIQRDGFEIEVYNKFNGKCFSELKQAAKWADIVHLNSVWNNHNIRFGNFLIKEKLPYVITVHGGLFEDRVKQSKYWAKIAYHYLFQKKIFIFKKLFLCTKISKKVPIRNELTSIYFINVKSVPSGNKISILFIYD